MINKTKIFKSVTALALVGGIVITTSPMVYAKSFNKDNCPDKPSFNQLQKQKDSHCYIDSKNIVHKGIAGPNDDAIFKMENFGSNLILNGQKILYGTEKVSDSMYHLYDGLNEDFTVDVMVKTYTEKDGIANLLQTLLSEGYTVNDAVEFIAFLDAHIYTGYGKDNFWYHSVNEEDKERPNNNDYDHHHSDKHHHDNDRPKQKIYS